MSKHHPPKQRHPKQHAASRALPTPSRPSPIGVQEGGGLEEGTSRGSAPWGSLLQSPAPMRVGFEVRDQLFYNRLPPTLDEVRERFAPPVTLGADPDEEDDERLAMDSHLDDCGVYSLLQHALSLNMGAAEVMPQFPGYAYLSGLAQNGLIRAGVETTADEMTRRWIRFRRDGEDRADNESAGKSGTPGGAEIRPARALNIPSALPSPARRYLGLAPDTAIPAASSAPVNLPALMEAIDRFNLRGVINDAAAKTEYFGGCLVYIDMGGFGELDEELLMTPLFLDPSVFRPGALRGFTVIEPINVAPDMYNASDPLRPDYFRPAYWRILGRNIHASRFLYFSTGEMPVLLRPAYNFFGIPTAQLALDYVAHFTQNRECASRLLNKFSLTAFKTNMSGILQGGAADDLDARLAYFVQKQNNDGCFVLDKDSEDLVKLETPLAGVTDIVRQSLEFVAAIFRLPVTKFLGVSPAGFNPTGEADRCNLYDYLQSRQEKILRAPLQRALEVLQMNEFSRVDPRLTFDFVALNPEDDGGDGGGGGGPAGTLLGTDKAGNKNDFKESEHPRDDDGKFTAGAGGGGSAGGESRNTTTMPTALAAGEIVEGGEAPPLLSPAAGPPEESGAGAQPQSGGEGVYGPFTSVRKAIKAYEADTRASVQKLTAAQAKRLERAIRTSGKPLENNTFILQELEKHRESLRQSRNDTDASQPEDNATLNALLESHTYSDLTGDDLEKTLACLEEWESDGRDAGMKRAEKIWDDSYFGKSEEGLKENDLVKVSLEKDQPAQWVNADDVYIEYLDKGDYGYWTIGKGLKVDGTDWFKSEDFDLDGRRALNNGLLVISNEEAEDKFQEAIAAAKAKLDKNHPWWRGLNGPRKAVVLSMMYNMDTSRFDGFKEFHAAMQEGDFKRAFRELLDAERTNQVKGRVTQEAMMLLSGQWAAGKETFPKEEKEVGTRAGGVVWGEKRLKERRTPPRKLSDAVK